MGFTIAQKAKGLFKRLKKGDIIFVHEKGIHNFLGKIVQLNRWHHVMLYIGDGKVLEAVPVKGCIITPLKLDNRYHGVKIMRFNGILGVQRKQLINSAITTFLHKKFSGLQAFRTFFMRKFGLVSLLLLPTRFKRGSYVCNPDLVTCSNLIAMSYYKIGVRISDTVLPEYVMPKDYEHALGLETVAEVEEG